ncbi:MAG: hypothetical protein WC082_00625 [Victivallales bacterium]
MVLNTRLKALIIPLLISVPIITVLCFFIFTTEPEALSSAQIIAKQTWNREELTGALASAFSPQTNRRDRHDVLQHLRKQLKSYPKAERSKIRIEALRRAFNSSLEQMRLLPEKDRKKLLGSIQKRAEESYSRVQKMSAKEKSRLRSRLDTAEGQAAVEEVNKVMFSKLTPEERREFAPVTKLWVKTLRSL